MLSALEALQALADTGTMGKAGVKLRLTQSAVSKRIAALEAQLGAPLVAKDGRRVVLTARAERLLVKLAPLTAELRAALADSDTVEGGQLTLGVSESILGSWGPALLRRVRAKVPGLKLVVHAHRSPAVVERVAAGEYMLGLVAGQVSSGETEAGGLRAQALAREPMVLIASGGRRRLAAQRRLPLITIESRSGTWEALARRAAKLGLRPAIRVESFFAVAGLAMAGEGDGLVPVGVATALRIPATSLRRLDGLARPIALVARPSVLARPLTQAFLAALAQESVRLEQAWAKLNG